MWNVYFTLNKASPVEADAEFGGVTVSVKLGTSELSVVGIQAADKKQAITEAEKLANHFLDTLCWKHGAGLAIDLTTLRAEEIGPGERRRIHCQSKETLTISERMIVVTKDFAGKVVRRFDSAKLGRIDVKGSEAGAYYRRGQLSSDPFDQFRNFYLVAENIADRIRTKKRIHRKLREQELLELALRECFHSDPTPLCRAASSHAGCQAQGDVIRGVAMLLYRGHRCQLSHAKASQSKKVPFNPEDERQVKAVLPLMEFVARSFLAYEEHNL